MSRAAPAAGDGGCRGWAHGGVIGVAWTDGRTSRAKLAAARRGGAVSRDAGDATPQEASYSSRPARRAPHASQSLRTYWKTSSDLLRLHVTQLRRTYWQRDWRRSGKYSLQSTRALPRLDSKYNAINYCREVHAVLIRKWLQPPHTNAHTFLFSLLTRVHNFTARRNASKCDMCYVNSLCPSHSCTALKRLKGSTWFSEWRLTLHWVIRGFGYLQNKRTLPVTLPQTVDCLCRLLHHISCRCRGLGPVRYMSISGHRVHFRYISFSVHQCFAMTISAHHSEQFLHVHFGTYPCQYIIVMLAFILSRRN